MQWHTPAYPRADSLAPMTVTASPGQLLALHPTGREGRTPGEDKCDLGKRSPWAAGMPEGKEASALGSTFLLPWGRLLHRKDPSDIAH